MPNGIKVPNMDILDYGRYVPSESIPSNSYKEYTISFNKSFDTAPLVVASVQGPFVPYTEVTGPNVSYVDASGFKVRVANRYSTSLTPASINWIAVGV